MNRSPYARRIARGALAGACALALAACSILPEKQPITLYTPEVRVVPDASWPQVRWQLSVPRPHAAGLVDSSRIIVRPVPGELQVYKGAVWAEPVPDLLRDALVRALEDSGRIAGVARSGEGITGDFELRLDVRRFESDYGGGASPTGRIEVGARLLRTADNAVVATRTFSSQQPAAGTDITSVTRALDTGLAAIVRDLAGWTLAEGQRAGAR